MNPQPDTAGIYRRTSDGRHFLLTIQRGTIVHASAFPPEFDPDAATGIVLSSRVRADVTGWRLLDFSFVFEAQRGAPDPASLAQARARQRAWFGGATSGRMG